MAIYHTFKLLIGHPLTRKRPIHAIYRFLKWQLNSRFNPYAIVYQFTPKSQLIISKGMTGATGNLYFGLHEFEDMAFLLHLLREKDYFLDAGANIGSYTILASGHVGCKSISIEPIPSTFNNLLNNIYLNKINNKVNALNIGLGKEDGELRFTRSLDTVNHISNENEPDTILVPIKSIDEIVDHCPLLIKMDVEGYETEVLKGAYKTLQNQELKAIIIELNGSGGRYGFDEQDIHDKFLELGFKSYKYLPFVRELIEVESFGTHNTIYIRDLEFVKGRIMNAETIDILENKF